MNNDDLKPILDSITTNSADAVAQAHDAGIRVTPSTDADLPSFEPAPAADLPPPRSEPQAVPAPVETPSAEAIGDTSSPGRGDGASAAQASQARLRRPSRPSRSAAKNLGAAILGISGAAVAAPPPPAA